MNNMSRYDNGNNTVYVGELKYCATAKDLEHIFNSYGPIKRIYIAQNPPGFAFIEYENALDAHNAIQGLQGLMLYGNVVQIKPSKPKEKKCSNCDCENDQRYRKSGSIASSRSSNYSNYQPNYVERCEECYDDCHNERKRTKSSPSPQFSSYYEVEKWNCKRKRSRSSSRSPTESNKNKRSPGTVLKPYYAG